MSEHENGNFVLKFGQNQQKYQPFMAISDFALLYRIRRSAARFQLLSNELPPTFRIGRQASGLRCFPELAVWGNDVPTDGIIRKFFLAMPSPDWICLEVI